jgi:hypothetical protein
MDRLREIARTAWAAHATFNAEEIVYRKLDLDVRLREVALRMVARQLVDEVRRAEAAERREPRRAEAKPTEAARSTIDPIEGWTLKTRLASGQELAGADRHDVYREERAMRGIARDALAAADALRRIGGRLERNWRVIDRVGPEGLARIVRIARELHPRHTQ